MGIKYTCINKLWKVSKNDLEYAVNEIPLLLKNEIDITLTMG